VINFSGVSFKYKKSNTNILDNITFDLQCNKVVGVIGPNGAGKTSLFDLIIGNLMPNSGVITRNWADNSSILLVQNAMTPERMTVDEITKFTFDLNSALPKSDYEKYLDCLSVPAKKRWDKISKRPSGKLSEGEYAWLIASIVLSFDKKLYLLDEPTAGVDPEFRLEIWDMIKSRKSKDSLLLVSSHLLDELSSQIDNYLFVNNGRISLYSSKEDFLSKNQSSSMDHAFIKNLNN
jgi:ABC-2 type transport system ATP-binding protein